MFIILYFFFLITQNFVRGDLPSFQPLAVGWRTATMPFPQTSSESCPPVLVNSYAVVSTGMPCPPIVPMMNSLVSSHEVVMERPGPEFLSPLGISLGPSSPQLQLWRS